VGNGVSEDLCRFHVEDQGRSNRSLFLPVLEREASAAKLGRGESLSTENSRGETDLKSKTLSPVPGGSEEIEGA